MTLSVDPVVLNAHGQWDSIDLQRQFPCNDLFGTQETLGQWIAFASKLQLPLLSRLQEGSACYANDELDRLADETLRLTRELEQMVPVDAVEYYAFRLRNLLEVIRLVRGVPDGRGGVWIG